MLIQSVFRLVRFSHEFVTLETLRGMVMNRLNARFVRRAEISGEMASDSHHLYEGRCTYKAAGNAFDLSQRSTNRRTASSAAALTLVCLLVLSGCSSVQVHLGMKVALDKIPVQSISASLLKGPGLGPGQKAQLVVLVTQPNGKVLQTKGANSKVQWKDLSVTAIVATVSPKGAVKLPPDPRVSDGRFRTLL